MSACCSPSPISATSGDPSPQARWLRPAGVLAGAGGVLLVVDVLWRGRHRRAHRARLPADLPRPAADAAVRLAHPGAAGADLRRAPHRLHRRLPVLALRPRAGSGGAGRRGRADRGGAVRRAAVQGGGDERGSARAAAQRAGLLADPGAVRRAAAGGVRDPVRHAPDRRDRAPPRHGARGRAGIAGEAARVRRDRRVRAAAPAGQRRLLPARVVQAAQRGDRAGHCRRGFVAQTLLAFAAIVCLPRQFHVAVVECQDPGDLRTARWLFGAYLVLFSVLVVPITLAGQALLGGTGVSPDTYVLALPLAFDARHARADGLRRRLLRGHRHGDRGERRAGDDGEQRPGDAAAAAQRRAARRREHRSPGAVGAARHHRGARADGLRLPSAARAGRRHAGAARPARVRRGRAVRAGADRRPVLARRQPRRCLRRPGSPARRVGLHAAAAGAGARGLAGQPAGSSTVRSASAGCGRNNCSA